MLYLYTFLCFDNKSLLNHYKEFHPLLKIYRCNDNNCSRSFAIFDSFKKHRYNKHLSETNITDNNQTIKQYDQNVDFIDAVHKFLPVRTNQSIQHYEDKNCENVEYIIDPIQINSDSDIETDLEGDLFFDISQNDGHNTNEATNVKFEERKEIINFTSKLYTYLDVPRVRVNDIVRSTGNLIDNYLLLVEKHLLNRLETFNLI